MSNIRKPGQFYAYNGNLFRLKRKIHGCEGCVFEKRLICPNTKIRREERLECDVNHVIVVNV